MSTTPSPAQPPLSKATLRSWSFWLGLLTSLLCVVWAIQALDWAAVAQALAHANYVWVSIGVLTVLLTILVRVARWQALLYPQTTHPSNVLAAMLVGQLLNYFAPARAGDVVRAYLLGHSEKKSKVWALGTVALEKLWDIWALLVLVILLSLSTTLPQGLASATRGFALLSLLAFISAWLALQYRPRVIAMLDQLGRYLPPRLGVRLHTSAGRMLDGLEGLRRPRVWFWSAIWSAVTWGIGALTNHTILLALGLTLPFSASMLLMAVLQLGVALPSLPGRIGIFEGLSVVVLALFGIDPDTAFAVGLVLHAVVFVPPILLGLYYVWRLGGVNIEWDT